MRKTPQEYAALIRERCPLVPEAAIILGSGLGELGEQIENAVAVDYGALPGFPVSTAPGQCSPMHPRSLQATTVPSESITPMALSVLSFICKTTL